MNEAWYALEGSADMDGPPSFSGGGEIARSLPYSMPRSIPHEEERFAHKVSFCANQLQLYTREKISLAAKHHELFRFFSRGQFCVANFLTTIKNNS